MCKIHIKIILSKITRAVGLKKQHFYTYFFTSFCTFFFFLQVLTFKIQCKILFTKNVSTLKYYWLLFLIRPLQYNDQSSPQDNRREDRKIKKTGGKKGNDDDALHMPRELQPRGLHELAIYYWLFPLHVSVRKDVSLGKPYGQTSKLFPSFFFFFCKYVFKVILVA